MSKRNITASHLLIESDGEELSVVRAQVNQYTCAFYNYVRIEYDIYYDLYLNQILIQISLPRA